MNPEVWGPGTWLLIHSITLNYSIKPTSNDKQNVFAFFNNLAHVLPCNACREHYSRYLATQDITESLSSRDRLVQYFFDFHNSVNIRNGKTPFTFNEFLSKYQSMYDVKENYTSSVTNAFCRTNFFRTAWFFSIVIIVALLVIIWYFLCVQTVK